MTPREWQIERDRRIKQAMFPLMADTRFRDFMREIEQLQDAAVEFMVSHDAAKDTRVCQAAMGEVRTLRNILAIYRSYQAQSEQRQVQAGGETT